MEVLHTALVPSSMESAAMERALNAKLLPLRGAFLVPANGSKSSCSSREPSIYSQSTEAGTFSSRGKHPHPSTGG